MAASPAYSNFVYMPIPSQYVRRLPILPPSSHANSDKRARRRGFLISWNYQDFWRLPPVTRPQFFAAVPKWFAQMETPIRFSTGGSLAAYYARHGIYRSFRDGHSVTMAFWVTEYLVMSCNGWYEEDHRRFCPSSFFGCFLAISMRHRHVVGCQEVSQGDTLQRRRAHQRSTPP